MSDENQVKDPTNEPEMREFTKELLRGIRHERGQWDAGLATLRRLLEGPVKATARHVVEELAKKEPLELQWKLDEILEATAPPAPEPSTPPPPPIEEAAAPEPEPATDPAVVAALKPEDLVAIYDDPRGLLIHEHAIDKRWFFTQVNPATGEPQTMELAEAQKAQIRQELAGSPYWSAGHGGGPTGPTGGSTILS